MVKFYKKLIFNCFTDLERSRLQRHPFFYPPGPKGGGRGDKKKIERKAC